MCVVSSWFAGVTNHLARRSLPVLLPSSQVVMGGGQEAMNVTTTGARHGHFEVRFFHRIFEEEVARVKGGFGPCNTIAVHPQGKGYSIGGEDGCTCLQFGENHACREKVELTASRVAQTCECTSLTRPGTLR